VKSLPVQLLIIFIALFTGQKLTAQYVEKDFILYSVRNGLSDNQITCLQQDDQGYLWIGTKAGLNRFDGIAFKKFYQGSAPIHLPSDIITRLKNFGSQRLGIFSRGGFEVLHTNSYEVSRYLIPDSTAFTTPLNAAWDAVQLPDGSFAMTTAAGFYVLTEKKLAYRYDAFNIKDIGRKQILYGREIFRVGKDVYLIYTNEDGQALYNSQTRSFLPIDKPEMPWTPFMHPRNFPGDRWVVKRQLNADESVFIPTNADSIIYYNNAGKKRVASPLPSAFVRQLNWESQFELVGDSVLLLNSGYTGFYRLQLDRQTGIIRADEKKFLSNYQVKCLFTDKDGRLWVGTTQGLLKQERLSPPIAAFQYLSSLPQSASDFFTCTYRYKNTMFAGQYSRHHGLSIIDASTMKRVKEIQFYGSDLPWNEVISIQMYHPDTLWIGTWAGLLWYDTKTERYGKLLDEKKYSWATNFPAVLAPPRSDGYAWFCAWLGGRVVRYHIPSRSFTLFSPQTNPSLPFEKVKSIVYDSFGDVWIGGHALTRWNNRLQGFDTVINVYAGANKFNDDIVALSADDDGSLWVHNADNGLLEYKIREKRFVVYGIKDGLPSALLQSLSSVIDHKLWIAGNNQLCLMDTRSKQFTVYDHDDGLPERIPSSRRIYFDPADRQLYLCAENYLVRFPLEPEKMANDNGDLLIEDLSINNDSTLFQPPDQIELGHNDNNLAFRFTVVDFERNNYQFAYRLNNSSAWNSIGAQHSISFNNLSPGEYRVELAASGKSGIRKTKSVLIVINPPFWARRWFIALVVLLILAVAFWLFRARLSSLRQKANIDRQLSQTEMKALQAQMNPHFIFNSLNSIREMILNQENKDASHYLNKFAQLIRITLEQSTQEMISLRATIDYLSRYIEMETIRNGFLRYEFEVDKEIDLDETLVSPMIIQPFVENAIWHGVSATRKDINVKISFRKTGHSLVCTVDDNGIGISRSKSSKRLNGIQRRSHGIINVQNRIKLLNEKYNLRCQVTIIDKTEMPALQEPGTLVTIQLPYQTTES
jgi:ligand-binding sensor domain-containing protein/two-component sensor histidine kinase